MAKPRKKPITPEEQYKIEGAVRREEWIEKGCPFFKTGAQNDRKKEESRRRCREKVELP
jgi:hypothetical protein